MSTGGVFRVRRVGEWLGQEPCENVHQTGGLAKGAGKILTLAQYVKSGRNRYLINISFQPGNPQL